MSGSLRTALLTIAAVLLSAGHAACACFSAASVSLDTPTSVASAPSAGGHEHGHAAKGSPAGHAGHAPALPGDNSHDDHDGDCSHCDQSAAAKAPVETVVAAPLSTLMKAAALLNADPESANSAFAVRRTSDAFQRYRRQGRRTRTPVTLKIRLRN